MSDQQRQLEGRLADLAGDLHANGVAEMFGVVGDPITPLVGFAKNKGIEYFGFRNEQAASYAASIVSFLTVRKRTGVVLTVAGPGFTNALTGLANASVNGWPVVLCCPLASGVGDFQGMDQISCLHGVAKSHVVYENRASVAAAIRIANTAPFGAVVVFIPVGLAESPFPQPTQLACRQTIPRNPQIPTILPNRPLLVIGSLAPLFPQLNLLDFVNRFQVPFVCDPMGRGVVPESHPMCVSAARNLAMSTCTSAIVVCGKLDWMLHHGRAPRWREGCRFLIITDDVPVEAVGENIFRVPVPDFPRCMHHLSVDPDWRKGLVEKASLNKEKLDQRLAKRNSSIHMLLPTHWEAVGAIRSVLDERKLNDSIVVSEGANTMDVVRVALDRVSKPRRRLDAGRWGTMGAGLGFALAASILHRNELVISVHGDSAFGFSGMELETLVRYKCKVLVIVFNNGGIYTGASDNATAFNPNVRHDRLMEALGGVGLRGRGDLKPLLHQAMDLVLKEGKYPVLLDILIDPESGTLSGSLSKM